MPRYKRKSDETVSSIKLIKPFEYFVFNWIWTVTCLKVHASLMSQSSVLNTHEDDLCWALAMTPPTFTPVSVLTHAMNAMMSLIITQNSDTKRPNMTWFGNFRSSVHDIYSCDLLQQAITALYAKILIILGEKK